VRLIDVERELVLARGLERELGAAKQRRGVVGVGRIHSDAERYVDEKRVAAHLELWRMLLGELDRGVHDGRHRVDADQHREAAAGEANDRSAGRQNLAELVRVFAAKELAALLSEGARDSIERVELAEQQTGEPPLLPLLQEFLDELDTRAASLSRSGLSVRRAHAASPLSSCR